MFGLAIYLMSIKYRNGGPHRKIPARAIRCFIVLLCKIVTWHRAPKNHPKYRRTA